MAFFVVVDRSAIQRPPLHGLAPYRTFRRGIAPCSS